MPSDRKAYSLERVTYILVTGLLVGLIFSFNQSSRLALIDAHSEKLEKIDLRAKKATLGDVLRVLRDENFLVMDVRAPAAFAAGSLPRAVNVRSDRGLNDMTATEAIIRGHKWSGILIYGSGNSSEPYQMARLVSKIFNGPFLVYEEGWDEWKGFELQWIPPKSIPEISAAYEK